MTLEQAQRAFQQQHGLAVDDLRKPFIDAVNRAERDLLVPVVKRPTGPFRKFLMRDFERVRADWLNRRAALESAKMRLRAFEASVQDSRSPLQLEIRVRTQERCGEADHAILEHLRRERVRREEAMKLADAVDELNYASGEEHKLLLPDAAKGKWSGTLVDNVELAGRAFARATNDRGYSYMLFPWRNDMVQLVGRPCWFWYDGRGRARFASQIAARPPLALPAARIDNP